MKSGISNRKSPRFQMGLKCEFISGKSDSHESETIVAQMKNLSRGGFALEMETQKIPAEGTLMLRVWLNREQAVIMPVEPVWNSESGGHQQIGYRIVESRDDWEQYVDLLEERVSLEL